MKRFAPELQPRSTPGAQVAPLPEQRWRLEIPAGPAGKYRLSQLDDYTSRPRSGLPWKPPIRFSLRARVSAANIPGTWGFGLWNDPFSLSLGLGGMARRFPALPNAAWFFFASPPNYLTFRDDLPGQGLLAQTFAAPRLPTGLMALASLGLPALAVPPAVRVVRAVLRKLVQQSAHAIPVEATNWHTYALVWHADQVQCWVDDQLILQTPVSPLAPLGLVLWIDNQYAALPPNGRLGYGFLPNLEPAWMELAEIDLETA